MEHLAFAPALSLASKIRHKDISARELLELYLQRVEHYNPRLNAIIFRQDEQARQRADAADAALAHGEVWGPLHGVPMTIKEHFDWVGSPSTRGNPAYQDNYPQRDAVAVKRLQAAGAIVFGKTNVPLMLADWQSFNDVYGTTNNPWDLTRSRVVRPGARPPPWRQGSRGWNSAGISAARSAIRPITAGSSAISRRMASCRVRVWASPASMRLPIWPSAARSPAVPTIWPWRWRSRRCRRPGCAWMASGVPSAAQACTERLQGRRDADEPLLCTGQ